MFIKAKKTGSESTYFHDVADDMGLPVSMVTGLNKADDAVLCYPAPNNYKVVTMATVASITTVFDDTSASAAASLAGILVNTAIASTAPVLYDGLTSSGITIPVGTAAGSRLDFFNAAFQNGLSVHAASVAGGSSGQLVIFWQPL